MLLVLFSFSISDAKLQAIFTLYPIAFALARKSYGMGLLFTHKNSDFGAITVTEPSWAAHIPKVERPNDIDSVNPFVSYFDAV